MGDDTYTLLELLDLALRVPEIGAVNFNILRIVIKAMLKKLGLQSLRTTYRLVNPDLAKEALGKLDVEEISSFGSEGEEEEEEEEEEQDEALEEEESEEEIVKKQVGNAFETLVWRTNFKRRMEATEEAVGQLAEKTDELYDYCHNLDNFTREIKEVLDNFIHQVHDHFHDYDHDYDRDHGEDRLATDMEEAQAPEIPDTVVEAMEMIEVATWTEDEEAVVTVDDTGEVALRLSAMVEEVALAEEEEEKHIVTPDAADEHEVLGVVTEEEDSFRYRESIDEEYLSPEESTEDIHDVIEAADGDLRDSTLVIEGAAAAPVTPAGATMELRPSLIDRIAKAQLQAFPSLDEITLSIATPLIEEIESLRKRIEVLETEAGETIKLQEQKLFENIRSELESLAGYKSEMQDKVMDMLSRLEELQALTQDLQSFADLLKGSGALEALMSLTGRDVDLLSSAEGFESGKALTFDFNQRFEDVWRELNEMNSKFAKISGDEDMYASALDLQRMIRKLNDELKTIQGKLETLDIEEKHKAKLMGKMQHALENLSFTKIDREEFDDAIELKADKRSLELKVDKDDFEDVLQDISSAIKEIFEKIAQVQKALQAAKDDFNRQLEAKLNINDYEKLQMPVLDRLRSIMRAFKRLKALLMATVCPEAGAITKCMCCGRSADILGEKFAEGGDVGPHAPCPRKDDYTMDDLRRPSGFKSRQRPPAHASAVSLPASSIIRPLKCNACASSTVDMSYQQRLEVIGYSRVKNKDIDEKCKSALEASLGKTQSGQRMLRDLVEQGVVSKSPEDKHADSDSTETDSATVHGVHEHGSNGAGIHNDSVRTVMESFRNGYVFHKLVSHRSEGRRTSEQPSNSAVPGATRRKSSDGTVIIKPDQQRSVKPAVISLPGGFSRDRSRYLQMSQNSNKDALNRVQPSNENLVPRQTYIDKSNSRISRKFTK